MSGPRKIDVLLSDPKSELHALTTLSLLALWIDRAAATNAELVDVLGAERCARIAYALGSARGEVILALQAYVDGKSKGAGE